MQPGAWALATVLLAGVSASIAEAQPMTRGGRPVGAPHPTELWNRLTGRETKAKQPAKNQTAKPAAKKSAEKPAAEEPPATTKAVDRVEREQRAFLRRVAVCDKLRQVALKNNDDELFRQADELQDRAWSLCLQRTGMEPVHEDSTIDQQILDQHLDAASRGTRVDRLYTVPKPSANLASHEEEQP